MTKIDSLRRLLLPCFCPATVSGSGTTAVTATKKRLSTSLREAKPQDPQENDQDSTSSPSSSPNADSTFFFFPRSSSSIASTAVAQPRPSKSMVIGTIFGHRRGHVWFCIQHDRLSSKPLILLEFPILTHQLVNEMRFGLVRIALECDRSDLGFCPLRSVPVWTMFCNGRKLGFAARRKANDRIKSMLKTMSSMTVGAGVMPAGSGFGSGLGSEEVMYMRANYEHVVGSADSESFHLINPDECPSQELSVFLLRSRNGVSH